MKNKIETRLRALRSLMKEKGIDAYLIPTDDFHASEYVGDHFKCREYITGFTGSAGTAVVTRDMAGLWTDGRYFIQAEHQLAGSGVTLFKMGEPEVPTVHEFLEKQLGEGQCLGFDGRTVSAKEAAKFDEELGEKGVRINDGEDLIGEIWTDRPALSCEPVIELGVEWTGKTRAEKCAEIRKKLREKGADVFLLTSLDDIAWLLNIRGNDVHCNPVVLSYLAMTQEEILLFANERAFPENVKNALAADGVALRPYDEIYAYAASIGKKSDNAACVKTEHISENSEAGTLKRADSDDADAACWVKVLLCRDAVNSRLVSSISKNAEILDEENPTLLAKAIKNPTEVENERAVHVKDGVALTKFIYWLKTNVGKLPMTELSAADRLYELRKEQEHFMGNSFDPIISYGPHAAIVHYSATPETDVPIEPRGLLIADTGGQYLEGTTDVTRTIVMGPLTDEEKKYFTLVLRGMLNLADVKFRYGCTGRNFDYIAREPLWRMGKDFNHGTGHGVGYFLNVHESPNSFRWKHVPERSDDVAFEEGMITSDEPGYYAEGKFGIRHENLILCKKAEKTETGQFMCFEHLTMVPFDLDGIVPEQMTEHERKLLNAYHAKVYETIAPHLGPEEREWLKQATRKI